MSQYGPSAGDGDRPDEPVDRSPADGSPRRFGGVLARRSLGTRLFLTLTGVIGVALAFVALVAVLLVPVRTEMSTLAGASVPQALLASKIDRQSAFVAAQASALVLARDDRSRAAAFERIGDELRALDDYLAELEGASAAPPPDRLLETVRSARRGLSESFAALNELVAQRLSLETGLEQAVRDLSAFSMVYGPSGAPADDDIEQGLALVHEVIHGLPKALIGQHRIVLERLDAALRDRLDQARALLGPRAPELEATIDRLAAMGFGPQGLLSIRRDLFQRERAIDGWLRENRARSDILRASTAALLAETADQAGALGQRINTDIGRIWLLALAAAGVLILAGFGIAGRIHQAVLARLAVIRSALDTRSLQPGTRLPVGGGDEIADIAAALERFVATIGAREAELREAREVAVKAAETRARFLANMSHELRTPMTGILGMADLLLAEPLPAEHRERLMALRGSAELLMALLNDVLDYSKIEAGRLELETTRFALVPLIQQVVRLFEPQAHAKGIALATRLPEPAPPVLLGDPYRLQQIMLNLVSNAVKFTHAGGVEMRVFVAAASGAGAAGDAPLAVVLEVADSGIGLSEDQQARLFQAFSQADASTTRRYGGTGLGLAITAHLVQLMGGRITCQSAPAEGAVFRVELTFRSAPALGPETMALAAEAPTPVPPPAPVVDAAILAPPLRAAADAVPERAPWSLSLLLAEDNAVNRSLLVAMLLRDGHRVDAVADGAAALAALTRSRPNTDGTIEETTDRTGAAPYDAALLDLQMPELDGLTVAARVRARPELSAGPHRLPLIALTADTTEAATQACRRAGFDAVLAKPLDWQAFRRVLARLAEPGPQTSSALQAETGTRPAAPEAPRRTRLIDTEILDEVRKLVGAEDFDAMLRAARDHLDKGARMLQAALAPGGAARLDALRPLVHALTGMAGTLGMERLAVAAGACEGLLRQGEGDEAELRGLRAVVLRTRAALEDIVGTEGQPEESEPARCATPLARHG